MNTFLKLITGLSISLTVISCVPKVDAFDTDKAIADLEKTLRESKVDIPDIKITGYSGGLISISGALVIYGNLLDSRVQVKVVVSEDIRKVGPTRVVRTTEVKPEYLSSIQKLGQDESFLNFGCDLTNRKEVQGLKEIKPERIESSGATANAQPTLGRYGYGKVLLICDLGSLGPMSFIGAETVILSNLKGSYSNASLNILAGNLVLEGENSIALKPGQNSVMGPVLDITATLVSGQGTLKIVSEAPKAEVLAQ